MSFDAKYTLDNNVFATGTHVFVHKCSPKSDPATTLIAKVYDKNDITTRRHDACLLEGEIGKKLPRHPSLMNIYEVFDEPSRVILVLEYMEGGNLFQEIISKGAMSEDRAGRLLFDVLSGLQLIHSKGIMHRDIKPENLFFRSTKRDVLSIGDYGFATNKIPATGYLGSPQYSAPELALIGIQGQHQHVSTLAKALYNEKCDLWSVGVIAFVMLTGLLPFDGSTAEEVFQSVIRNSVPWDKPECRSMNPKAKQFIQSLLESNPSKRPSAQQALRNPWIATYKH